MEAPQTNTDISIHVTLCEYLDLWLSDKKQELRQSTYEGYACRINSIKKHFQDTCCSLLINKGWDLKKLQYWLGHSDASTTLNIYSHFNRKRMNESQNDLNSISAAASDIFIS
ncbi:MAG: tyrosine-type recombinase/integrase [Lachnospiraceae bacterium]|nr:tyrosine-type recombinase/integrase [Lachnospiraceae bacterium]